MNIEYYIFDPAGNITALVTSNLAKEKYKTVAAAIMKKHPSVEQVGFVNFDGGIVKLNMSGGEFCGNATLSAAALYAEINGKSKNVIPVAAYPTYKPINVSVLKNYGGFACECIFAKPDAVKKCSFYANGREYTFPLVCFDGIMHIVADNTLGEIAARSIIKPLAEKLGAAALGIMLYNSDKKSLEPLVFVSAIDSLFRENSCASGSCALAAVLPEFGDETVIKEPGGDITVRLEKEGIYLKSNINFIGKYSEEM